jgi:hypothetical protein
VSLFVAVVPSVGELITFVCRFIPNKVSGDTLDSVKIGTG